ncbi:MAG: phosphoribosylformylglycinamidine cyclo-ligase [Micavibrio sp.]|nr:phosphoribosylformylglycinamidine cyclo-ligase [Micavibrio sp.]
MTESAYKKAGVDIEAAADLVENIKPHIKKTIRSGVMSNIGGFGALFDLKATGYKDPILVSGTDGVGTKIKIAIDTNRHDTIGIDAVAMCVNDIIVQGAEPLFFLDYFATGHLDNNVAEAVIKGIAQGCAQSGCALIGGETAEMPGLYADGDYDIAGFSVGAVERDQLITGEKINEGDVILGLASSGLHSNGFSLVRKIIESAPELDYESPAPFTEGKKLADFILTPTRLYVKSILGAIKTVGGINGLSHITGGGLLENVPRVLPENVCAEIDCSAWNLPPVFKWLAKQGKLTPNDLATTLNTGIGMIIICDPAKASLLKTYFTENGDEVYTIGRIAERSDAPVKLLNMDTAWAV